MTYGLCQCGCGQPTQVSKYTFRSRGWFKGQPRAFVKGHNGIGQVRGRDYAERDCGYSTPCWVWCKTIDDSGYAVMTRDRCYRIAHVVYYERTCGPVPEGMELDHLCRNRACVNPAHLEPVTHKENMVRGMVAAHVPGRSALRDARIAARMSQSDLAAELGTTQSTVSHWELGQRELSVVALAWLDLRGGGDYVLGSS